MKQWYTFDLDSQKIICVEGPGYPGKDTNGRPMYDNSHFATWQECYDHSLQSFRIRMECKTRGVKAAKAAAQKFIEEMTEIAMKYSDFVESHPIQEDNPK